MPPSCWAPAAAPAGAAGGGILARLILFLLGD
jgi:hypothetical protein